MTLGLTTRVLWAALMAGALSGRAVLVAWTPHRHFHAALVAALIVLAFAWLPRVGITKAVYIALLVGLALGGGFL